MKKFILSVFCCMLLLTGCSNKVQEKGKVQQIGIEDAFSKMDKKETFLLMITRDTQVSRSYQLAFGNSLVKVGTCRSFSASATFNMMSRLRSIETVSYTHLDVYKRQPLAR